MEKIWKCGVNRKDSWESCSFSLLCFVQFIESDCVVQRVRGENLGVFLSNWIRSHHQDWQKNRDGNE